MNCNVCGDALGEPIYRSTSGQVLTSLCEVRPGSKVVWSCRNCAHLRAEALPDTEKYYATGYRISLDEDDEDQIYEVQGDRIRYRTEHQVDTLMSCLALPEGAALLDYGCAKASTYRHLGARRPDLQLHLFDVSDMYVPHWDRFVEAPKRATFETPAPWQRKFDVVTSFFALEHIPEPQETVDKIAALLKDDGIFYGIVPDAFGNVADFVVIDHVNHFTIPSLHVLLQKAGFRNIDINPALHRGALVFQARKGGAATDMPDVDAVLLRSRDLAAYWTGIGDRVRQQERARADKPSAIYGSGFYGAYIASLLRAPDRLRCFLDRSPYQQGKNVFGKPVVAPGKLADDVRVLYVGLNPAIARSTVAEMEWLAARDLDLVFLDEGSQ